MPSFTIARSALERLPVLRVEVWVDTHTSAPGPDEPAVPVRHVFEPGASPGLTDPSWTLQRPETVTGYRLRTLFDGHREAYESPTVEVDPTLDLVVIEDLGVRVFDAHALPFGTIQAVEGSYHDLAGQPRQFRLTAGSPLYPVFAGKDYKYGEPIAYGLDYLLTDGNYREPDLRSSRSLIPVTNPLTEKTVTFEAVGLSGSSPGGTVEVIQLAYSHLEDGPGWSIAGGDGVAQLSDSQPTKTLTFAAIDPERALSRYQGTTIRHDGEQVAIPEALVPETTIRVGDAPLWWTVRVDPSLIDWTSYLLVAVELRADNALCDGGDGGGGSDGGDQPRAVLLFWQGVPDRYWSFQIPLEHSGTFSWRACYIRANGTSTCTEERTETSHQAILLAHPPAKSAGREAP